MSLGRLAAAVDGQRMSMDSDKAKAPRPLDAAGFSRRNMLASDTLWITLLTLLAFSARLWDIGGKGLWYDEASTALMARAGVAEIVQFHWRSAFEHPPLWVLLMHFWSMIWGQSEFALRLPAAFAGALLVPLMWQNLKFCWPADHVVRFVAALFIALSPVLLLYGQEARMYAIVALLAATSIYLFLRLQDTDGGACSQRSSSPMSSCSASITTLSCSLPPRRFASCSRGDRGDGDAPG